jgi:hypothetical protein
MLMRNHKLSNSYPLCKYSNDFRFNIFSNTYHKFNDHCSKCDFVPRCKKEVREQSMDYGFKLYLYIHDKIIYETTHRQLLLWEFYNYIEDHYITRSCIDIKSDDGTDFKSPAILYNNIYYECMLDIPFKIPNVCKLKKVISNTIVL